MIKNHNYKKDEFKQFSATAMPMNFWIHRYVAAIQSYDIISHMHFAEFDKALEAMQMEVAELFSDGQVDVAGTVYDRLDKRVVAFLTPAGGPTTKAGQSLLSVIMDPEWIERCIEQVESHLRGTPSKRRDGTDIWDNRR